MLEHCVVINAYYTRGLCEEILWDWEKRERGERERDGGVETADGDGSEM